MQSESFNLKGLARYLGRDARDLEKLAVQGRLPGQRIAGDWRFHRTEVHHWLEQEMPSYSDKQLEQFEATIAEPVNLHEGLVVRPLLSIDYCAVPLDGRTAAGVLRSLVNVANTRWQVYEPAKILDAVRERESLGTTAMPGGVALPHPGRRMKAELSESLIAFGRTNTGIPFGGPHGQLTDHFFLILAREDRTHLQCLARLSRMLQRPDFIQKLRESPTPGDALDVIERAEEDVV